VEFFIDIILLVTSLVV